MTFRKRLAIFIVLDSIIVLFAIFAATWIVYPGTTSIGNFNLPVLVISSLSLLLFHHLFAFIYKLYNKVWEYASVGELKAIVKAVTLSIVCAGAIQFLINDFWIYRRAFIVTWLLHIILIGGSRFTWRIIREQYIANVNNKKRTLIVGAGAAGSMIARQLHHSNEDNELLPVGFVDDDQSKLKMEIYEVPVLGTVKDISKIVEKHNIDHVVIAIPSLRNDKLKEIVTKCNETKAKVQMIPKIEDLMSGKISVSHLKNVEVEDVLGRKPVDLDIHSISEYVTGNTVMVTGAGGSIGSEICRQLMEFTPGKIILLGHGEFSIYTVHMELQEKFGQADIEIVPIIGDVQDRNRMFDIMKEHQPSIIYHTAAHKHVPLKYISFKRAREKHDIQDTI